MKNGLSICRLKTQTKFSQQEFYYTHNSPCVSVDLLFSIVSGFSDFNLHFRVSSERFFTV